MAMPLTIVVLISMLKDLYEDIMRHKDDTKENNSKAIRIVSETGNEEVTLWHDIRVGDLIKVN